MLLPGLSPDWLFQVSPLSAISSRRVDQVVVSDLAGDLIRGTASTWGGIYTRGSSAYAQGDWKRLGYDLTLDSCGFARFMPGGEVESFPQSEADVFGGFYATPTSRNLSCGIVGADVGVRPFLWQPAEGTWRSGPSLGNGSGIYNTTSGKATVMSQDTLPANSSFEAVFDFFGSSAASGKVESFTDVGPNLRLALYQGRPPVLQKRLMTVEGGAVQPGNWATWKRLSEEDFDARGTRHRFALSQIGGRMVAEWNDKTIHLLDENDKQNQLNQLGQRSRAVIPTWGGTPLRLQAEGCKVRVELSRRDHLNDDETAPRPATVTRVIPLASAQSYQPRMLEPLVRGFIPEGADLSMSVSHDSDSVTVTTTITPSPDGAISPMATQMLLVYSPVWVNGSGAPVDVSKAITNARVTLAQPPTQAGSEGSITLDLHLAQQKCSAALPLLKDFAPIEISARWRDDATGQPVGNYRGLMQGYLMAETGQQPTYNGETLKWNVRDPIVRLQDEAGLIDSNFYDLIYAYQRITKERIGMALKELREANGADGYRNPFEPTTYIPISAGAFYCADAVKELLLIHLGPTVANRLNGTGAADRFYPKGHPSLLNRLDLAGSIAPLSEAFGQTLGIGSIGGQNGSFFPTPYGDSLYSFITGKIAPSDLSMFWFGHVDRDTDSWPVPIYGVYEEFLSTAKGWKLGAAQGVALAGLIEDASYETQPEKNINRVLVWSSPFGSSSDLPPNTPALVQGEARTGKGPWLLTRVFRESFANWATTPKQAEELAGRILSEFDGVNPFLPKFKTRGDASWLAGDVFYATGLGLNINDLYTRAATVTHEYTVDSSNGTWWTTEVAAQSMSRSQIRRFTRKNNLPGPL